MFIDIVFFLIALILRIRPALERPIIFDEAFTVVYLNKFNKIIDIINHDPSVPPLQYLLIKLMSLFSTNLFWLRVPSLTFSVLAIFFIFRWINSFSKSTAFFVLIFLTFSTLQITYSWQAYVYSQLFFFSFLSIYFFYQSFFADKINWWQHIGFLIFSLAAWFTHYGYIWTFLGLFPVIIFSLGKSGFRFKLLNKQQISSIIVFCLILLCLLAYSPILINNFNKALVNIKWEDKITVYSLGFSITDFLGLKDQFRLSLLDKKIFSIISSTSFIFLIIYHLIKKNISKKRKQLVLFLTLLLVTNLILPLIISLIIGQSVFIERSLIFVSLPLTILLSFFLDDLSEHKKLKFFSFVIIGFFIFYSRKVDRNTEEIIQHQEASKYYTEWFRDKTPPIRENINILLFDSLSPFPYIDVFKNYNSLDYYWYGYDGRKPLPKYQLITIENFEQLKNKPFYMLIMQNSRKIDIKKQKNLCQNPEMIYEVEKTHSLNIYRCN